MQSLSRTLAVLLGLVLLLGGDGASAQNRRRAVRSAPGAAQPTSFELIDRAATEGKISADQALLFKVFAVYGDPRLPQEMRGDDSELTDSTFMSEVASEYETLPVDVQQQVAPFLIPPFHENSWWELRRQQQANGQTMASHAVTPYGFSLTRPCTDCPLRLDWEWVPTTNGKVKVWYYGSSAADKAKAQAFATEIDQVIWPQLTALMGREPLPDDGDGWLGKYSLGGDTRLDIALVDIARSVTMGRYIDHCKTAAWSYIQFERTKGKEELAHELMHSFQYAFNVKVRNAKCSGETEYRWLMESTAEWVKDYIYPGSTSPDNEHPFAPKYLSDPEKSLNYRKDPRWYGAYLLPFFVARLKGQTIVGQVWANTESMASLQAIEEALKPLGGFEKVWPEFVLHNWNDGPVDDYRKIDQLQARPQAHGDTLPVGGAVDTYVTMGVPLPHLSATYRHFDFTGQVNSVAFLNGLTFKLSTEPRKLLNTFDLGDQYKWEPVPPEQKRGASVQAILKRNGKWEKPEDWTNIPYKAFCLQKPEERIEEIVLIFANSSIDESYVLQTPGLPPLLIATDMGCRFEGMLDWDTSTTGQQGYGNLDLQYRNTFEPRDFMEPVSHFLGYYYKVSGHASWSVSGSVGPCGVGKSVPQAPIRTDLISFSMNFAPKNSKGYRKGYYQLHIADPVKYALHCPTGDVPREAQFLLFPAVSFDPLMYVDNVPGGALLGKKSNPLGEWKWDYKLKK